MDNPLDDMPNFPPNPPGYGEVVGGVALYDSPPAVVEAACRAYWPWWDDMFVSEMDDHRIRMKAAIRAAIDMTCARSPTQEA